MRAIVPYTSEQRWREEGLIADLWFLHAPAPEGDATCRSSFYTWSKHKKHRTRHNLSLFGAANLNLRLDWLLFSSPSHSTHPHKLLVRRFIGTLSTQLLLWRKMSAVRWTILFQHLIVRCFCYTIDHLRDLLFFCHEENLFSWFRGFIFISPSSLDVYFSYGSTKGI